MPVPLFQAETVFLYKTGSDFNGTPEDLKGRTVGYQSGIRWIEKSLPSLGAIPQEVSSNLPIQELLMRNRFEVYAIDSARAHLILQSTGAGNNTIQQTSWNKISFFHVVHRKHQDKVDALTREIKTAIDAGEFDQVFALPGLTRVENDPN